MEEKGMEKEENFLLYLNRELNGKNIMIKKLQQKSRSFTNKNKQYDFENNNFKPKYNNKIKEQNNKMKLIEPTKENINN